MRSFLIVLAALVGAAVPSQVAAQCPNAPAGGPRCFQLDLKVTERTPAGSKCLAEPRLITLAGRPACFVSGGQVPVPAAGRRVEIVPVGLRCECTVTPAEDGSLRLEADARMTSVRHADNGATPKFDVCQVQQVGKNVRPGETVTLRAQETRSEKCGLVRWTEVTITVHEVAPPGR